MNFLWMTFTEYKFISFIKISTIFYLVVHFQRAIFYQESNFELNLIKLLIFVFIKKLFKRGVGECNVNNFYIRLPNSCEEYEEDCHAWIGFSNSNSYIFSTVWVLRVGTLITEMYLHIKNYEALIEILLPFSYQLL